MIRRLSQILFVASAALPLCACDAQTDPSYKGEPLQTLRGTITTDIEDVPTVNATLLWNAEDGDGDKVAEFDVPVQGTFPSSFTMDLLAPPPPEMLIPPSNANESAVGTAFITVLSPDAASPISEEDMLGVSEDHVLVYVAGDIQPGTYWESILHGQLPAGYHLMKVKRPNAQEQQSIDDCKTAALDNLDKQAYAQCDAAFRGLFPSPGGFNDSVNVHIAPPDQLKVPHFY